MARGQQTILVVASVIDEDTGAIVDSNVTVVENQQPQVVDQWKKDFKVFGEEQTKKGIAAGTDPSNIKQHRHSAHHGK